MYDSFVHFQILSTAVTLSGTALKKNSAETEQFFAEGTSGDVRSGTQLKAESTLKSDSAPGLNEVAQALAQMKP